jgi:exopolysaccharide biosynthesis polyprenyl glycosylphosphotransferase
MLFVHKWSTPITRSLGSFPFQDEAIYPEVYFHHVLTCERKRTERSHRPFLLMLAEIQNFPENDPDGDEGLYKRIVKAITLGSRDIDFKGWYVEGQVMGVIFTELNGTDIPAALNQIAERVRAGFQECLSQTEYRSIDLSFHVYPEGADGGKPFETSNHLFYPDIKQVHTKRHFNHQIKRTIDVLGSALAIILFSPVMLLIAVAIKLTSPGPVLFRQERIGQYGKRFSCLKFRSMKVNNDCTIHKSYVEKLIKGEVNQPEASGLYKISHDPRITAVGRFIRKTSLDELPQFFNVLMGEMSIVGPRPPIPYELEQYDTWHRTRILSMKPGITGLWQVFGRSRTTFDEMVRMDIRYIRNWSLWMDLQLIIATPWMIFTGRGGC